MNYVWLINFNRPKLQEVIHIVTQDKPTEIDLKEIIKIQENKKELPDLINVVEIENNSFEFTFSYNNRNSIIVDVLRLEVTRFR